MKTHQWEIEGLPEKLKLLIYEMENDTWYGRLTTNILNIKHTETPDNHKGVIDGKAFEYITDTHKKEDDVIGELYSHLLRQFPDASGDDIIWKKL